LNDETGQQRNRVALVMNQIRPLVEQYRGNAIRMNIIHKAKSISPSAVNRRETELAKALFYTDLAKKPGNPFAGEIKKKKIVGENEGETMAMFENTYVDQFVKNINGLAQYISLRNEMDEKKVRIAEEMALTGLGVMSSFEYAGHQVFETIPSETFIFDRGAQRYDLSDAQFMGEMIEMFPSEIFEMYQELSDDDRRAIDNYSKFFSNEVQANKDAGKVYSGKVPVFKMFWRDGQRDEYGYVRDKYGYEYFTKINYTYPGEDKPRYTDKDLIKSNSERAKKLLGNNLKTKNYCDVLRTCVIIPREILASVNPNVNTEKFKDVCLDWGIVPYQDTEMIEYNTVKFPYKCYTWGYINGEIFSPVDDAIDPQRFINRIWSVSENQVNNAGGIGVAYDSSMVRDQAQFVNDVKHSRPLAFDARGRGIQNAISSYDGSIKAGTLGLYNLIDAMKASIKETTGVNDSIQGQSQGQDQLVGVTELMIQRGSLMQEPFYNGIVNIFKQCYQSMCNVGKRIYADNDRNITIAVGDDGAEVIKITKEMKLEDFRSFVFRENSDEMIKSAANAQLLQFYQLQMIDQKRYANLYNRATPDDVAKALREYAAEKEEIRRNAEKQAKEQEGALMEQAQMEQQEAKAQQFRQEAREDERFGVEKQIELIKEDMKQKGKSQKKPVA
jgi:hypothetical protein